MTFNGKPIHVIVPPLIGDPPNEPNFLAGLSFGDPVRVTGALVSGAGREVPMLGTGDFRMMKLYDA